MMTSLKRLTVASTATIRRESGGVCGEDAEEMAQQPKTWQWVC